MPYDTTTMTLEASRPRSLRADYDRNGLVLIAPASGVGVKDPLDFVAHPAEHGQLFFLRARGMGGVVERPAMALTCLQENRTRLVRIASYRDDGFHTCDQKLVHVFGTRDGIVHAHLRHHFHGQRVDVTRGV